MRRKLILTFTGLLFFVWFSYCLAYAELNNFMPTISLSGYDSYPISSGEEDCYIISNDNILFHISKIEDAYVKEKVLEDVVGVFGGVYAITSDNSLWAWGDNEIFEAKGISVTDKPIKVMNDVKYVQRNGRTTFIIKTDNTLWGIGLENTFPGTFKTDDTSFKKLMNNILNVQLGDLDAWVLKTDNSVWSLSSGKIMRNVKNLFSGMDAFYAVNDNDELWRWGTLYGGLIGRDESDKDYPEKYIERAKCVSPHYGYNLVIRDDDTLWLYGKGYPDDGTVINQKWLTLNNLNMPIKIMDDVNSLSGWTHRNNNRVLILNNSGEVYEFSLFQNAENEQVDFSISKITDNVKLAQEFVANKSKDFEDIQDMSDEAKDSIRSLATAGIIEGNENGDFLPNETISRAEAIKSLHKNCRNR